MQKRIRYLLRRMLLGKEKPALYYIAPDANWSLDWDAHYITRDLHHQGVRAVIRPSAESLFGQLVHFGSLWETFSHRGVQTLKHNRLVATVFHGDKTDPGFREPYEDLFQRQHLFSRFVVSCQIMEDRLALLGLPASKIARIPLGVDLSVFAQSEMAERTRIRQELGIDAKAFVIGSFQKDGVGMDEGLEPKFIKGPDVFLRVVEQVSKDKQVFVLLSGPARGYVKAGLDRLGVAYKHVILDDYLEIQRLYNAADAYLMTSREEGGPKGVLEALACGVPLVATRVGLAPDVVTHEYDGLLAQSEDVNALASAVLRLAEDEQLAETLVQNGLQTIRAYDWSLIAARYYHEIYKPILDEIG